MSNSYEKSVKGGTKIKLAAPKSKYVEHILVATHAGEAGVEDVFRTLTNRLRDSTWTIVFKGLIIVHLMIREGEPNVTLKYLAESPSKLAISNFSEVQVQGTNIRHYYNYVLSRAKAYRDTKLDWVKEGQGRLKRQTIDKGLLRETESVQKQIAALLKCDLLNTEAENEITLTAFRLLTMDLLILYHVMNEGTINVLEHYFEMSKYDADRALGIYKTFSKQTNEVVDFLGVARQYENATRLEIPKLKHAPTSLTSSLEEYLHDPDFEINRRQYLAQQEAKKGGKFSSKGNREPLSDFGKLSINKASSSQSFPETKPSQAPVTKQEPKGPAPDLIDFFESIEQNQQPMAAFPQQQISNFQSVPQYQYQQQGFAAQPAFTGMQNQPQQQVNGFSDSSNPFGQPGIQQQQPQQQVQPYPLQLQSDSTGAAFGGFTQQRPIQVPNQAPQLFSAPISSAQNASFAPQQSPFAPTQQQSPFTIAQQQSPFATGQQSQSSNPFRQSMMPQATNSSTPPFSATPPFSGTPVTSPLNRQSTNPFARGLASQQSGPPNGTPFNSPPPPQSMLSSSTASSFFATPLQSPEQQTQTQQTASPLQPTRSGTNPFARSAPPSQAQTPLTSPLVANQTSTNPFRHSAFVNPQTGQSWQATQGTMGGLENLETIPVFPRPGQQTTWPR
ncbi:hypothetical protein MMC13_000572 [Lambiella insularis]|nr:hypothetical protein [Lambiella insularis]